MNILITGGTGLIGRHLIAMLRLKGHTVYNLTRAKNNTENNRFWDWKKEIIPEDILQKADTIIYLAGANIGTGRWTPKRKQLILNSRTKGLELIYNRIFNKKQHQLKSLITASAVGYYGAVTTDRIFEEKDLPADDFVGTVCHSLENKSKLFEAKGVRTVQIRTSIVLTTKGGALPKISLPIKLGLPAILGDGKQYLPWIHIDDLCKVYIKAIEDPNMSGPYNAVAPHHIQYIEFVKTLGKVLKRKPNAIKIPAQLLKIFLGEMSLILLKGSRISTDKLLSQGFDYTYQQLHHALTALYQKK